MRTLPLLTVAVVGLGLLATGCVGDPFEHRLRSCGVLSDGTFGEPPLYAPDACYRACLGRASCEELTAAFCGQDLALLLDCDAECAFRCDDGALFGVERVCDGREDCAAGEDEVGCALFTCEDGEGTGRLCDGRFDCRDQSDEIGCPGTVDCGPVERSWERRYARACDGWEECADGRDEESCARTRFRCSASD